MFKGDKVIKKHSLSGNRLRNHTITGTQVNMKRLGKVRNARHADSATNATNAGHATNATNATNAARATNADRAVAADNATSAANLAGESRFIKSIAPAGTDAASGAKVVLGTSGPLTVEGICYMNGANVHAGTYLVSTVTGFYNSYSSTSGAPLVANTPVDVSEDDADAAPGNSDYEDPYDGTFSGLTGTLSNYITGLVSNGVNLTSANDCTFAGFTSAS
jgi:hypothetical protein